MKIEPVKLGMSPDGRGISQVVCVRMNSEMLSKVDELAKENDVSRSSVIVHAINKLISRRKRRAKSVNR